MRKKNREKKLQVNSRNEIITFLFAMIFILDPQSIINCKYLKPILQSNKTKMEANIFVKHLQLLDTFILNSNNVFFPNEILPMKSVIQNKQNPY